jgi:hypothetical protein
MKQNYVDIPVPVATSSSKPGFEPLQWAKRNCPSYITNDAVQKQGEYYYRFYFGREQDQIVFALRWL